MADRKFLKTIDDKCEAELVDLGFKRPRRGAIYLEINPAFIGWVGLNQGNHGEIVNINPNVGIHCVPAEKLWRDLVRDNSRPYRKGESATFSLPLGSLAPREIDAIQFLVDVPTEREARRLSLLVGEYGVPWMLEHASYDALIPLLEQHFAHLPNYPERLAAMYYFSGDVSKAAELIDGVRDRLLTEQSETGLKHFNKFAVPFLEMLEGNK